MGGQLYLYLCIVYTQCSRLSLEEIVGLYGEAPLPDITRLRWDGKEDPTATLRAAAAPLHLLMGSESSIGYLGDAAYQPHLFAQYDLTEPENECKPDWICPVRGVFDTSNCSFTISQMNTQGQGQSRACCVVWGQMAQPPWLRNGAWNFSSLSEVMRELMFGIMGAPGVRGNVLAWDVVNEAICDKCTNTSIFKGNTWWPTLGDGYVEAALRLARQADPSALLFVNEYGAEDLGEKSDRMYNMVKDFKARGVPIDGVGFQMHMSVNSYGSPQNVSANMKRLGELGLLVHVTEVSCAHRVWLVLLATLAHASLLLTHPPLCFTAIDGHHVPPKVL